MRNSLKTNYIVAKFKENYSPLCSFCSLHDEKIEHLFWDCALVQGLLNETKNHFDNLWRINLIASKKNILFGKIEEPPTSPSNLLIHHFKKYIWQTRCLKAPISLALFINWFRKDVDIIKKAFFSNRNLAYLQHAQFTF